MRFINLDRVVAMQLTTPADNPLVTDESRLVDVWFDGSMIRKQMFKKVKKAEQEEMTAALLQRGFIRSGNLLLSPRAVLFAEMENSLLGGIVTVGYGENGKPVEFKIAAAAFAEVVAALGKSP